MVTRAFLTQWFTANPDQHKLVNLAVTMRNRFPHLEFVRFIKPREFDPLAYLNEPCQTDGLADIYTCNVEIMKIEDRVMKALHVVGNDCDFYLCENGFFTKSTCDVPQALLR